MFKKFGDKFVKNLGKRFKNVRFAHRECTDDPGSRCAKMTYPPKKKEDDCTHLQRISELRRPKLSFVTMWEDPECCRKYTCDNHQVRYDDLYYRVSNKYNRNYMRTWVECPEFKIVPVECKTPKCSALPMEKRPRKPPPVFCNARDVGLMKCNWGQDKRCPKMKWPKCKEVAGTLHCHYRPGSKKCKKFCTPYPSFSECRWEDKRTKYRGECKCLALPMQCEIIAELKKQEKWDIEHPKREN